MMEIRFSANLIDYYHCVSSNSKKWRCRKYLYKVRGCRLKESELNIIRCCPLVCYNSSNDSHYNDSDLIDSQILVKFNKSYIINKHIMHKLLIHHTLSLFCLRMMPGWFYMLLLKTPDANFWKRISAGLNRKIFCLSIFFGKMKGKLFLWPSACCLQLNAIKAFIGRQSW